MTLRPELLHFALKSCYNSRKRNCYILRQKLLQFGLMLHFASKFVTFCVNVTFCVSQRQKSKKMLKKLHESYIFVIYDSPEPRPPPFLNTPTRPATILSGMRSSLLIEILTGTHVGSRKLFT